MSEGHPTFVRNRRDLAGGLFTFSLDPPEAVRGTFHTPGQYHRLAVAGVGESYFALASAPTATTFDYLARTGSTVADALINGTEVKVSKVMGPGFPVGVSKGHNLVLVATGTGIAPIRSVIQTVLPQRAAYLRISLVYGVRTEPELAFSDEFAAWAEAGIELHITLSKHHPGWQGEVGRVQQRIPSVPVDDACVFLCGQAEMEREVSEILVKRGVSTAHIFVNH